MPITINGTTVVINSINGTSISKETVNGTRVYGGTGSRIWYNYTEETSEPSVNYAPYTYITQGVAPTHAEIGALMTSSFPPANIPIGTIGWIYYTNLGTWYMLMVVEE